MGCPRAFLILGVADRLFFVGLSSSNMCCRVSYAGVRILIAILSLLVAKIDTWAYHLQRHQHIDLRTSRMQTKDFPRQK